MHTITYEILPSNIFFCSVESIESTSLLSYFDSPTYFGILEIKEGEGIGRKEQYLKDFYRVAFIGAVDFNHFIGILAIGCSLGP